MTKFIYEKKEEIKIDNSQKEKYKEKFLKNEKGNNSKE